MSEDTTGIEARGEAGEEAYGNVDAVRLASGLSGKQAAAFGVLTSGGSISAAARAAHVMRNTIYAWLEPGHAFSILYEQWKRSIAEISRTRLLMIGEAATMQIARSVRQGDVRTALAVAKGMGLLSPPAVGPALTQIQAKKTEALASKAAAEVADKVSMMPFADLVNTESFEEEMRIAEEIELERESQHERDENGGNDESASESERDGEREEGADGR